MTPLIMVDDGGQVDDVMVMLLERRVMVMLCKMVGEGMMMAGMRLGVMTVARVMAIMR